MITLVVRRTIAATPERLFDAWTIPEQLLEWWGPQGVVCVAPEIDLRAGGRYRLGNRLPDGRELWISGEFEIVERPHRLVYTWRLGSEPTERVTVRFEPNGATTDVIVTHEGIADAPMRDQHELGWVGCLNGLERFTAQG